MLRTLLRTDEDEPRAWLGIRRLYLNHVGQSLQETINELSTMSSNPPPYEDAENVQGSRRSWVERPRDDSPSSIDSARSTFVVGSSSPVTSTMATDPVIMSWVPPSGFPSDAAYAQILAPPPNESPPDYFVPQLPTTPVVYTFSPTSADAMLLIPSSSALDTRPRYHISVRMNCFIPTSSITTVRNGAHGQGKIVGEFEMGIADARPTVFIRGKEFRMFDVLARHGNKRTGTWEWRFIRKGLFWDCRQPVKKCFSKDKQILYAQFTPVTTLREPNEPAPMTELEVLPPGQEFFDDIILSILIIERWRLTPSSDRIFNYST